MNANASFCRDLVECGDKNVSFAQLADARRMSALSSGASLCGGLTFCLLMRPLSPACCPSHNNQRLVFCCLGLLKAKPLLRSANLANLVDIYMPSCNSCGARMLTVMAVFSVQLACIPGQQHSHLIAIRALLIYIGVAKGICQPTAEFGGYFLI